MPWRVDTPTEEDWPAIARADGRAFAIDWTEEALAVRRPIIDLSRYRIVRDEGDVVAVAGSYEMEVTVPGGAALPMGGVTWVSVSATHRRRGLLRLLMDAVHRDIDERGEPVAMLTASEGGIYGRFGYGVASEMRKVSIDRPTARLRPDVAAGAAAGVRWLGDTDEVLRHVSRLWPAHRRMRPGEMGRSEAWQQMVVTVRSQPMGSATSTRYLAHDDGYVALRVTEDWPREHARNQVEVTEVVALTPEAHQALWATVLGLDLVGTIESTRVPLDDPLPFLFQDPRTVTTRWLVDHVWACPRDVGRCLAARTYGVDGALVVEVTGDGDVARWRLEGGPDGATTRRVRSRPDLVTDRAGLGSLLLGGLAPSYLAAGRRLEARSPDVLRLADAMFRAGPLPLCQTPF